MYCKSVLPSPRLFTTQGKEVISLLLLSSIDVIIYDSYMIHIWSGISQDQPRHQEVWLLRPGLSKVTGVQLSFVECRTEWNRMAMPQQFKCTSFSTSIYYEGGRHCNRWKWILILDDISQSKVAPKNSMVHAKHSQTSAVLCAQNFHPCHFADMPCPSGQATQRPPAWKLDLADLQDTPCGDPGHATSQRLCGDKACYLWDINGYYMILYG